MYFNINIGTVFFVCAAYILLIPITGILRIAGLVTSKARNLEQKISDKIYWNHLLRLVIECYLDITISIGLNLIDWKKSTGKYASFKGVQLSNACAVFFSFIMICLPIFILSFYLPR